jgi:hypothetical protein
MKLIKTDRIVFPGFFIGCVFIFPDVATDDQSCRAFGKPSATEGDVRCEK